MWAAVSSKLLSCSRPDIATYSSTEARSSAGSRNLACLVGVEPGEHERGGDLGVARLRGFVQRRLALVAYRGGHRLLLLLLLLLPISTASFSFTSSSSPSSFSASLFAQDAPHRIQHLHLARPAPPHRLQQRGGARHVTLEHCRLA